MHDLYFFSVENQEYTNDYHQFRVGQMTRKEFVPATSLNFIAASWIQFMTHDWISHGENDANETIKIPLAAVKSALSV